MDLATVDHLLTSTRSVRKRLDLERPVDVAVIEECIDIAMQAPTGSNAQGWHFVIVTDVEKRAQIGAYYGESFRNYVRGKRPAPPSDPDDPRAQRGRKVLDSSTYLSRHMQDVPVLVIPCIEGRVETGTTLSQASLYGSILPATWSLMLALRARGLGSAWTTLHLAYEREIAELLGIPDNVTQAALLPVAYFTGEDFRRAKRTPAAERTYFDQWGATGT